MRPCSKLVPALNPDRRLCPIGQGKHTEEGCRGRGLGLPPLHVHMCMCIQACPCVCLARRLGFLLSRAPPFCWKAYRGWLACLVPAHLTCLLGYLCSPNPLQGGAIFGSNEAISACKSPGWLLQVWEGRWGPGNLKRWAVEVV